MWALLPNPGGLALRGPVRNWARIVKGKPKFNKDASSEVDFSPDERKMVEEAAGRVIEPAKTDSPQPDNAHTARSHPLDGPEGPIKTRWPLYGRCRRPGTKGRLMDPVPPRAVVSWKGPGVWVVPTIHDRRLLSPDLITRMGKLES